MLREGMFLGDRYEILELIGVGGMACVYRAKCHKLNRLVAIKVLKREYCQDANFVSKFKAEAQAAAGLTHPNIVGIYDVGDEGELHYIVMELVEGITLKEYIEKKGTIEIREAVGITIQIAQGIGAAHDQHIIHRDIKPQNVIISKEGKVKVTDFGIAKVASSQTINSDAVGSVYYFSPEQARGGYSDERSDIYSLGISLYEMLTGKVPFEGDSTVSIALAHLNNEITPPRQIDPTIPISLEKIILKATQKKPERRYSSAAELIADLRKALLMPDEDFVTINGNAVDDVSQTIIMSDADLAKIKQGNTATSVVITDEEDEEKEEPAETAQDSDIEGIMLPDEEDDEEDTAVLDKIILVLGIILTLLIFCVAFYFLATTMNWFKKNDPSPETSRPTQATSQVVETTVAPTVSDKQSIMPYVVGMGYEAAADLLRDTYSLGHKIIWESSEEYAQGIVIKQEYPEGTIVDKNTQILLTVSEGSSFITIPSGLVGKSASEVQRILARLGLAPQFEYEHSTEYKAGDVIRTSPSSGKLSKNDEITIFVSKGEEIKYTMVPELRGKTVEDAEQFLISMNLLLGTVTEEYSEIFEKGEIISQKTEVNTQVEYGTKVDVVISKGREYVTVPNLLNMSQEKAEAELEKLGLKLGKVMEEYSEEVRKGLVISYSKEDQKVKIGTEIDITISLGIEMVTLPNVIVGRELEDITKELLLLKLEVTVEEYETTEVIAGCVYSSNYKAGTEVPVNTTINLVVAVMPPTEEPTDPPIELPSQIVGKRLEDIKKELDARNLKYTVETIETTEVIAGCIYSCNYRAGALVEKNAVVQLVVAVAPPTTAPTVPAETKPVEPTKASTEASGE